MASTPNPYINIYLQGITPGLYNSCVSSDGSDSNPVVIGPLNLVKSESGQVRAFLACSPGYQTIPGSVTSVQPVGQNASKWQLAIDNSGSPTSFLAPGAAINFTQQITAGGVYFWIKASSVNGELLANDITTSIVVTYSVQAVA